MPTYSVAEARNNLPKLIDRARAGEDVVITRRGKPVARLNKEGEPQPKLSPWELYQQLGLPIRPAKPQTETGAETVRKMRDAGY